MFDAAKLEYRDYSVKFYALPLVPIYVILWSSNLEFPASASVLFDSSVSNYLSTEQIAAMGELSAFRLKRALEAMTSEK
jgi:hypothetical protein